MALTDVVFIGTGLDDDRGYAATICEKHNRREIATYVYQLEEVECMACVAELDRERQEREDRAELAARRGHPSICLCPACAPWEAEYDRMQAEELARLFVAEIRSPNYCGHWKAHPDDWGCQADAGDCRHPRCAYERANPPF